MNALLRCNIHISTYTKLESTQALSIQKFMILIPDVVATFVVLSRKLSSYPCAEHKLHQTCILLHKSTKNLNINKHQLSPQSARRESDIYQSAYFDLLDYNESKTCFLQPNLLAETLPRATYWLVIRPALECTGLELTFKAPHLP